MEDWLKFELKVKAELKRLGYMVLHSLYLSRYGQTSQIDLVAFKNGNVYCIECKSHPLRYLKWGRSRSTWGCIDIYNKTYTIPSPKTQNKHHAELLTCVLRDKFESEWFSEDSLDYRVGVVHNVVVFWDNLQTGLGINRSDGSCSYKVSELDMLDNLLITCYSDAQMQEMYDYLAQFQDESKSRAKEHGEYIRKCKKNKTGLWKEEIAY